MNNPDKFKAKSRAANEVEYPSSDGKPMAETETHLRNMLDVISDLTQYFRASADVYVCGNMLMYYVPGNKRKHVSPDVFVVRGLDKRVRDNYLVWEEGKAPDFVIELTSASTRREDLETKFKLYRDVLKVEEYFLFDPQSAYLTPSMQGYRLRSGRYVKIRPVNGRLPSKVLGLYLEKVGTELRLFDPSSGQRLQRFPELYDEVQKNKQLLQVEVQAREQAEADLEKEMQARQKAEAELESLRREIAANREEKTK
jgi:Uma2 family endonuclease